MATEHPAGGLRRRPLDTETVALPMTEMEIEQALNGLRQTAQVVVACGLGDRALDVAARLPSRRGRALVIEQDVATLSRVRRSLIRAGLDEVCRAYAVEMEASDIPLWRTRTERWIGGSSISQVFLGDTVPAAPCPLQLLALLLAPALVPGETAFVRIIAPSQVTRHRRRHKHPGSAVRLCPYDCRPSDCRGSVLRHRPEQQRRTMLAMLT